MSMQREWKSGYIESRIMLTDTVSKHDNVIDIACPFPNVNVAYLSLQK